MRRIQTWNSVSEVKYLKVVTFMPNVHVPGTGFKSDHGQTMTDRYHWRRKMFYIRGGGEGVIHKTNRNHRGVAF